MDCLYLADFDAHLCFHDLPGQEPAGVYLHGLGSAASADFPAVVRDPALASYRAVLIDLLGFGFSDQPAAFPHTLEAHAETVARLLDHLGLSRCHVVGHSMGGSIATALAAARPDLVSGLVVAECNFDPEDATFSGMIIDQSPSEAEFIATGYARLIAQAEEWARADPAFGSYPGTLRASDPRAVYCCSEALVGCRLRDTFFGLSIPRTYVFGAKTLPHHHAPLMVDGGVPVAVVPDAGHGMVSENPSVFATIVASSINRAPVPAEFRLPKSPGSD